MSIVVCAVLFDLKMEVRIINQVVSDIGKVFIKMKTDGFNYIIYKHLFRRRIERQAGGCTHKASIINLLLQSMNIIGRF